MTDLKRVGTVQLIMIMLQPNIKSIGQKQAEKSKKKINEYAQMTVKTHKVTSFQIPTFS